MIGICNCGALVGSVEHSSILHCTITVRPDGRGCCPYPGQSIARVLDKVGCAMLDNAEISTRNPTWHPKKAA